MGSPFCGLRYPTDYPFLAGWGTKVPTGPCGEGHLKGRWVGSVVGACMSRHYVQRDTVKGLALGHTPKRLRVVTWEPTFFTISG